MASRPARSSFDVDARLDAALQEIQLLESLDSPRRLPEGANSIMNGPASAVGGGGPTAAAAAETRSLPLPPLTPPVAERASPGSALAVLPSRAENVRRADTACVRALRKAQETIRAIQDERERLTGKLTKECDRLAGENSQLSNTLDRTQSALSECQEEKRHMAAEIDELRARLHQAESERGDLRERNQYMEREQKSFRLRMEQSARELKQRVEDAERFNSEMSESHRLTQVRCKELTQTLHACIRERCQLLKLVSDVLETSIDLFYNPTPFFKAHVREVSNGRRPSSVFVGAGSRRGKYPTVRLVPKADEPPIKGRMLGEIGAVVAALEREMHETAVEFHAMLRRMQDEADRNTQLVALCPDHPSAEAILVVLDEVNRRADRRLADRPATSPSLPPQRPKFGERGQQRRGKSAGPRVERESGDGRAGGDGGGVVPRGALLGERIDWGSERESFHALAKAMETKWAQLQKLHKVSNQAAQKQRGGGAGGGCGGYCR
ncbi:unnamed protein product [Vitrella brassicaformis CCMP3155]|uniref:Uncharacterized protein n=2 Tax=Vitrella brassicaformis TaxID=1169539 RepID=A0A0G4GID4_VITBC|nr:unnamed protein product [Vitrella brassicaformis CCMP3155]|eukprot:CEM29608.1 unnamed protein product [Vitrella brassicaformis CCMP3155]